MPAIRENDYENDYMKAAYCLKQILPGNTAENKYCSEILPEINTAEKYCRKSVLPHKTEDTENFAEDLAVIDNDGIHAVIFGLQTDVILLLVESLDSR